MIMCEQNCKYTETCFMAATMRLYIHSLTYKCVCVLHTKIQVVIIPSETSLTTLTFIN